MHKLINGMTIVVATHNPGKIPELKALLGEGYKLVTAGELSVPEPEETGTTFIENALLKARHACEATGLVALADDSGLSVTALNGEPGIYSARWREPGEKDFAGAMEKVRVRLAESGSSDSAAWFTSALAVVWPDGHEEVFEGEVHGHLEFPPRGQNGFGYDPIFVMSGLSETFGEIDRAHKDAINHRAVAFMKLKAALMD